MSTSLEEKEERVEATVRVANTPENRCCPLDFDGSTQPVPIYGREAIVSPAVEIKDSDLLIKRPWRVKLVGEDYLFD